MKTVYFTDQTGRLKSLTAEVDTGRFCMIVMQDYLAENLPNAPVEPLKDLPCTYSCQPIRDLIGTVEFCACCVGRTVSTRVYVGGTTCLPLIGRDLIDGLELSIHGRGCSPGLGMAKHTLQTSTKYLGLGFASSLSSTSTHCAMMRVQAGCSLSRCMPAPEPCLKQTVCEARTGCNNGQKKHARPAVDKKMSTQANKHGHTGPEQA